MGGNKVSRTQKTRSPNAAQSQSVRKQSPARSYDLFVSHAFADKKKFVTPLVRELKRRRIKVWYDEDFLLGGQEVLRVLNQAMRQSRRAIVVFSKAFLARKRGVRDHEYHVLLSLQLSRGRQNTIIPILYGVTKRQVSNYDAALGGRYHLDYGVMHLGGLVDAIVRAVKPISPKTPKVRFIDDSEIAERSK